MDPQRAPGPLLPGAKELHEGLKRAIFEGRFEALLLFDIDGFHQTNLDRGTETGDQILALIGASILERGWRGYRIGGDEFGLILRGGGETFDGEDFRVGVSLLIREKTGLQVTISGGGVRNPGKDFGLDPRMEEVLFSVASQLLIQSKKQGRNQILWLPDEPVDSADITKITVAFYKELARINTALARQLEVESRTDFLTGLYNRRGFEDIFRRLAEASRRNNNPMALIYLDSDTLKQINDAKGHDAGDRFIMDMSMVLSDVVRGSDFISRWGADEFAVIVDNTTRQKALALAKRIHRAIADRTEGTVSIGVYCGVPQSTEEAVKKADEAMYKVKRSGKNGIGLAE
ncbi:diguanylate cyclase [bacterium]|nr:diguanylate cyclase [bacterium]